MSKNSYSQFIEGLEKLFGQFDAELKKFNDQSNSIIARKLFYSDSQFSRLINQTASEGEYARANKIISRYTENLKLKDQIDKNLSSRKAILINILKDPILLLLLILSIVITAFAGSFFKFNGKDSLPANVNTTSTRMDHMLEWAFELSDVKPYTSLDDLPDDCNFPCYRLQGKWKLHKPYKFPVFSDQRGFHYLATDVNMYARCISENNTNGEELEGYEYQKHEIWYDIDEQPIDSFLINAGSSVLKQSYNGLQFAANENFILVAHVHTFFRNVFNVSGSSIERKGKVIGRYIEYEDISGQRVKMNNMSMAEIQNQVNTIVNTRVEDYSRPIQCGAANLIRPSFHDIEEMDLLSFDCIMTTGRVPISYQKTYYLENQAIKNHCRKDSKS